MNLKRLFFSLFLAFMAGALAFSPALAFPPLPSSFYGQVKNNGQNVPDGTLVRALVGGKAYVEVRTETYQGNSVYSLNVPGDEADSSAIEGGKEGEVVQFEVGGVMARESGAWHSGTNVKVDLSLTSSGPLASAAPARPAVATQTAISAGVGPALTATPTTGPGASSSSGLLIGVIPIVAIVVIGGAAWLLRRKK